MPAGARIQLCGRFVVAVDGSRHRGRAARPQRAAAVRLPRPEPGPPLPRDELLMAGWGEDAPAEARNALNVLLSKLRHGLGADRLRGGRRSSCCFRRRRSSTSRRRSRAPTGRSPASPKGGGRRPGVRPGSRTTSPPGRSSSGSGAVGRRVAAQAGGGPAARAGVLRRGQPRPQRPGTGASGGARQDVDHACALS